MDISVILTRTSSFYLLYPRCFTIRPKLERLCLLMTLDASLSLACERPRASASAQLYAHSSMILHNICSYRLCYHDDTIIVVFGCVIWILDLRMMKVIGGGGHIFIVNCVI